MRVSIMQPYLFPYLGYFHLMEASDVIVLYDDVNYLKAGWVNRNRLLLHGEEFLFTVPVSKGSQNKRINEIRPVIDDRWRQKFENRLYHAYRKSPNFEAISQITKRTFAEEYQDITDMCLMSLKQVYEYLGIDFVWTKASSFAPETRGIGKADRLIQIVKKYEAQQYVNVTGGQELYSKKYFQEHGIDLYFVKSFFREYKQRGDRFVPGLSIIDLLMFNDKEQVKSYFKDFELV